MYEEFAPQVTVSATHGVARVGVEVVTGTANTAGPVLSMRGSYAVTGKGRVAQ